MNQSSHGRLYRFLRSRTGSAVEFVLICPFLFLSLVFLIDAGNLFSDYRYAQQVAESVVRTARSLDVPLQTQDMKPLDSDSTTILKNVAARLETQAPEGMNYVWLGRFVGPQSADSGGKPRQLLPDGVSGKNNEGLILAGASSYAEGANRNAANVVAKTIAPGEIIYVANVTFSRRLLLPILKRQLTLSVRYSL